MLNSPTRKTAFSRCTASTRASGASVPASPICTTVVSSVLTTDSSPATVFRASPVIIVAHRLFFHRRFKKGHEDGPAEIAGDEHRRGGHVVDRHGSDLAFAVCDREFQHSSVTSAAEMPDVRLEGADDVLFHLFHDFPLHVAVRTVAVPLLVGVMADPVGNRWAHAPVKPLPSGVIEGTAPIFFYLIQSVGRLVPEVGLNFPDKAFVPWFATFRALQAAGLLFQAGSDRGVPR